MTSPPLPLGQLRDAAALAAELDTTWVLMATVLVVLMQGGFALVELGLSRGKNAGTVVAKIAVNLAVVSLVWWVCGFALSFGGGGGGTLFGDSGFLLQIGHEISAGSAIAGTVDAQGLGFALFQLAFCAISLAIAWGTTLERVRFVAYPLFAIVFTALIYPIVAHAIFGGGVLSMVGEGMQDFAGSTVVHLTGATAGLAALLLVGPRRGKYEEDGTPRAIPGHSMPLFGLGVVVLWVGWFGFNAGSTGGTDASRLAEIAFVTNLAAAAGVIGGVLATRLLTGSLDVGMVGNGAIGALVAITAPSGFVEAWAAPIIGGVAGAATVWGILWLDRRGLDDPVGALSAHGFAGVWGTLACGLFASPRLLADPALPGAPGLVYSGSFGQLGVQAVGVAGTFVIVFALSYLTLGAIAATVGLRVNEAEEREGLDLIEHGMYGYPEQFISTSELEDALGAMQRQVAHH